MNSSSSKNFENYLMENSSNIFNEISKNYDSSSNINYGYHHQQDQDNKNYDELFIDEEVQRFDADSYRMKYGDRWKKLATSVRDVVQADGTIIREYVIEDPSLLEQLSEDDENNFNHSTMLQQQHKNNNNINQNNISYQQTADYIINNKKLLNTSECFIKNSNNQLIEFNKNINTNTNDGNDDDDKGDLNKLNNKQNIANSSAFTSATTTTLINNVNNNNKIIQNNSAEIDKYFQPINSNTTHQEMTSLVSSSSAFNNNLKCLTSDLDTHAIPHSINKTNDKLIENESEYAFINVNKNNSNKSPISTPLTTITPLNVVSSNNIIKNSISSRTQKDEEEVIDKEVETIHQQGEKLKNKVSDILNENEDDEMRRQKQEERLLANMTSSSEYSQVEYEILDEHGNQIMINGAEQLKSLAACVNEIRQSDGSIVKEYILNDPKIIEQIKNQIKSNQNKELETSINTTKDVNDNLNFDRKSLLCTDIKPSSIPQNNNTKKQNSNCLSNTDKPNKSQNQLNSLESSNQVQFQQQNYQNNSSPNQAKLQNIQQVKNNDSHIKKDDIVSYPQIEPNIQNHQQNLQKLKETSQFICSSGLVQEKILKFQQQSQHSLLINPNNNKKSEITNNSCNINNTIDKTVNINSPQQSYIPLSNLSNNSHLKKTHTTIMNTNSWANSNPNILSHLSNNNGNHQYNLLNKDEIVQINRNKFELKTKKGKSYQFTITPGNDGNTDDPTESDIEEIKSVLHKRFSSINCCFDEKQQINMQNDNPSQSNVFSKYSEFLNDSNQVKQIEASNSANKTSFQSLIQHESFNQSKQSPLKISPTLKNQQNFSQVLKSESSSNFLSNSNTDSLEQPDSFKKSNLIDFQENLQKPQSVSSTLSKSISNLNENSFNDYANVKKTENNVRKSALVHQNIINTNLHHKSMSNLDNSPSRSSASSRSSLSSSSSSSSFNQNNKFKPILNQSANKKNDNNSFNSPNGKPRVDPSTYTKTKMQKFDLNELKINNQIQKKKSVLNGINMNKGINRSMNDLFDDKQSCLMEQPSSIATTTTSSSPIKNNHTSINNLDITPEMTEQLLLKLLLQQINQQQQHQQNQSQSKNNSSECNDITTTSSLNPYSSASKSNKASIDSPKLVDSCQSPPSKHIIIAQSPNKNKIAPSLSGLIQKSSINFDYLNHNNYNCNNNNNINNYNNTNNNNGMCNASNFETSKLNKNSRLNHYLNEASTSINSNSNTIKTKYSTSSCSNILGNDAVINNTINNLQSNRPHHHNYHQKSQQYYYY